MKFVQGWHVWVDASGALTGQGGRRLTVGVSDEGAVFLGGEGLADGAVRLAPDAIEALGDALACARTVAAAVRESVRAGAPAAELAESAAAANERAQALLFEAVAGAEVAGRILAENPALFKGE